MFLNIGIKTIRIFRGDWSNVKLDNEHEADCGMKTYDELIALLNRFGSRG